MSLFNLEKEIKCACGNIFEENDFSQHFKHCKDFKKDFKTFDQNFSNLLKNNSEPKEKLLIIRFLLKQYVSVLGKKIKAHFIEINQALSNNNKFDNNNQQKIKKNNTHSQNKNKKEIKNNNFSNTYVNNININSINNNSNNNSEKNNNNEEINNFYARPFSIDVQQKKHKKNKNNSEACIICSNQEDINYLECLHCICKKCFLKLSEEDLPNMTCPKCKKPKNLISENDKKNILGQEKYEEIYNNFNMLLYGNLVECPNCKEKISFEPGEVDYNIKDENNKIISKIAAEHYANNRCRCPGCHTIFCQNCHIFPYHLGKTCDEYKKFISSIKCRYDNTVITNITRGPCEYVCMNRECIDKYNLSCKKNLNCGHKCWGCKYEKKCPPCLEKTCKGYINHFDQDIDSYCNICFIEGLGNSPIVLLSCNHYIHYKCLEMRLKKKWNGPKITFNHCLCPMCNKWLDCPNVPEIQSLIDWNKKLYEKISKMALERLKFEGLDKDKRLTDKNSKWYNNELQYALNRITYYMCYQCKEPYFAGLRECGDGPLINNNDPNKDYDPKDCVCGKHANIYGVAGVSDCKIHGKEFIEYKCRFCCKIASWFCWGTTHFCDECHARQCKGDYISKYPKEALPKHDPKTCQIKVPHPPNGEEFALGCRVCRIEKNNVKNF